ncbi:MAG: glycosyltransferase family 39 protein [Acidobacteria bacterium]|nr:glycosyltransferase family 39 protein [Acidobacteriota bacterium]
MREASSVFPSRLRAFARELVSRKDAKTQRRRRIAGLLLIVLLALAARGLTAQFIGARLSDAGWFPYGIYAIFDRQAQSILDGRANAFWIGDPSQTEAAIYPPGYPLWLALVYALRGARSAAVVQGVQWVLDSFAVLLVAGIGVTAFGWRVGIRAGVLAALSPLLALYGAMPLADAPTSWLVLGGAWLLVLAWQRRRGRSWRFALGAGLLVGLSCWLRANAMLLAVWWALALLLFVKESWKVRVRLAACVLAGAAIFLLPIVVRNIIAFRAFVPTGMGVGTNLWEGIGETDRAAEFGAVYGDGALIEKERAELGVSAGEKFNLYFPDGVERDRARARKAFAVIKAHPVWYAGVMARRMAGVLNYAGEPSPVYGSAGFNVTSRKCLEARWQGGVAAFFVNLLGMAQSVMRYVVLPLMLLGLFFALRSDARAAGVLLTTVLYYLCVGSFMHAEIRYGLPMQALLFVFAGVGVAGLPALTLKIRRKLRRKIRNKRESRTVGL